MPDYFYHIGIELFANHFELLPVNLSQTLKALNPFTSRGPRAERDHRYDSMRPSSSSFGQAPISSQIRPTNDDDQRIDNVVVEATEDISAGIGTKFASAQTRALFEGSEETPQGERGIVHLYRDAEETPGLYRRSDRITPSDVWNGSAPARARPPARKSPPKDEDCTMLAILAVPSYMTPRDFLAFVGQDTRNAVTHFRMIRTSRLNRYMVLMKFKDGRYARQWQSEWNTKLFNTMEPESCHVVFVKSVEVWQNQTSNADTSSSSLSVSQNKPVAPPTPSLVELPTCPVCLERMDESTGLIANLCQHVFHCTCLEKWSGYGCPVCRFKDDSFSTGTTRSTKSKKHLNDMGEYEVDDDVLECYECRIMQSLWQCLICGLVGCGRYASKHAYRHFENTGHTFALDIESQRVWDYDRDCYVHRIIADGSTTSNEKLVELPGRRREGQPTALEDVDQDLDMAKRENLAFEYTQLLTSQLESQRIYFEDLIAKAVDNRTKAAKQAEIDANVAAEAKRQSEEANALRDALEEKCKQAEKEAARHQNKSQKLEAEVKELRKQYGEARMLADTISENTKAREKEATIKRNELFAKQAKENQDLKEQNATQGFYLESLKEQVEDMRVQIDAQAHLQKLVKSGQLTQEELDGATIRAGSATAQTSTTTTPSRRTKSSRNTQPIMTPRNDPTDEEIKAATAHWIENPYKLGRVASLLRDKIANDWRYTADANEADIIELGLEKGFLMWKKDKTVGLKEEVPSKEIESYLCEASIIAPVALQEFGLAAVDNPERAAKILQAILGAGSGYELAPGKSSDDLRNALIQGGVLQPKEEEGLYDSDDGPADGEAAKSKAKKKRKSKKKK